MTVGWPSGSIFVAVWWWLNLNLHLIRFDSISKILTRCNHFFQLFVDHLRERIGSNWMPLSDLTLIFDPRGRPQFRPVVITIYTQIIRPTIRPSENSTSSDNHCRLGLYGLAEWIIDDSQFCLFLFFAMSQNGWWKRYLVFISTFPLFRKRRIE